MNILLVGIGSIGVRHLRNLMSLGYNNISGVSKSHSSIENFSSIQVYKTIEEATWKKGFDAAFVCTVTASHINDVLQLLNAGVLNIYLEKPVSHNFKNIDLLVKTSAKKNANIKVGYDLHFDLGLQKLKQLLQENIVGKPLSVNAFVGQYLPDWRPQKDYRQSMSAKMEAGGGVMLDLIHEFDYLLWLVGEVKTVATFYNHTNTLDIETEDVADVLLQFNNSVTATIHLDYLQPVLKRSCTITCSEGTIEWDYANTTLLWITKDKKQYKFNYKQQHRNDRLKESIKTFLENKNDDRLTSLEDGIESLKLVLAAKRSSEEQAFINMKEFTA